MQGSQLEKGDFDAVLEDAVNDSKEDRNWALCWGAVQQHHIKELAAAGKIQMTKPKPWCVACDQCSRAQQLSSTRGRAAAPHLEAGCHWHHPDDGAQMTEVKRWCIVSVGQAQSSIACSALCWGAVQQHHIKELAAAGKIQTTQPNLWCAARGQEHGQQQQQ